ncbi:hypothetical protein SDJN03_13431, partial [Cucurbita argyrosperma subsp. sororia]
MDAISYSYIILDERTKISSAAEDFKHDLQFGCVSLVHRFPHVAFIVFSMISIRPANHSGEDCLRIHFSTDLLSGCGMISPTTNGLESLLDRGRRFSSLTWKKDTWKLRLCSLHATT